MLKNTIPFIDMRGKTPVDMLRAYPDKAHALIRASRRTYGLLSNILAVFLLPWVDKRSHRWLKKAQNPYLHEIENFADLLRRRGVYTLNLCYEWGCTSGAYLAADTISLLRVLDWPFPDLGKHLVVALYKTPAGEYYNVTWPGLSGVYQAMAPQRFAAALNQAPMRKHGLGIIGDWFKNRLLADKEKGMPPAHLLRQVFERANNYQEAKEMLCNTKLAVPAIFTLTGLNPGEACIIERLENTAEVKEMQAGHTVNAANDFMSGIAQIGDGWRPREPDSAGRYRQSMAITGYDLQKKDFNWMRGPIINPFTRLVMQADAATEALMVQGFDGATMVTDLFVLPTKTVEKEAS